MKSLDELIAQTKAVMESEDLSEEERAELDAYCKKYEQLPEEELKSMNHFLHHMPSNDSDITLIVIKAHLLIEQIIREFVSERMLNPSALTHAKLNFNQVALLAEALILPNDEPKRMWSVIRKLNTLRNAFAHNLSPPKAEKIMKEIIDDAAEWQVKTGFVGVLAHLYGKVSELCRLAKDTSFDIKRHSSGQDAKQ